MSQLTAAGFPNSDRAVAAGVLAIPENVKESSDSDPTLRELSVAQLQIALAELFYAIQSVLYDETESVADSIRRAAAILGLRANIEPSARDKHSPTTSPDRVFRGGLAPWQVRTVRSHIDTNLDSVITTADLATLVGLSKYHFSRAFRESFADSPHAYMMRRRIERAQGLMLKTSEPLATIAISCGLADQAHFTRLFRRFVGSTPGAWRRARTV